MALDPTSLRDRLTKSLGQRGSVIFVLALFALTQGFYAVKLNEIFYTHDGPFYDSLAYYDNLAYVLSEGHQKGVLSGLTAAVSRSTVALPFVLAAVVSPFVGVSRAVGVWLQVPWIFALLLSGYAFFRIRLQASRPLAVAFSLPLASIHAIYNWNGGLSDFRMDLQLYLLFGCAMSWFILAVYRNSYLFWGICGVFCGLATLARATAPIYLVAAILPIFLLRLFLSSSRLRLLIGAMIAGVIAAMVSAWFLIYRFKDLYYYYFIWNSDANAHLPLSVSWRHFAFALGDVGVPVILGCLVAALISIDWDNLRWPDRKAFQSWPWETLVVALMPAGFLAFRGAGLNPFVSMPSAFGIVAFILCLAGTWRNVRHARAAVVGLVVLVGCACSAWNGWAAHSEKGPNRMGGYRKIIAAIQKDARERNLREARLTITSLGWACDAAVLNTLLFDKNGVLKGQGKVERNGIMFSTQGGQIFSCPTYVDWKKVPGENDAEKIDSLVKTAAVQFTYLVVPSDETLTNLEKAASHNFINNYARWLKARLLKDLKLKPISPEIEISPRESYTVFAVDRS